MPELLPLESAASPVTLPIIDGGCSPTLDAAPALAVTAFSTPCRDASAFVFNSQVGSELMMLHFG